MVLALLCREARESERREADLFLFGGITELTLCLHTEGNDPEEVGTLMM